MVARCEDGLAKSKTPPPPRGRSFLPRGVRTVTPYGKARPLTICPRPRAAEKARRVCEPNPCPKGPENWAPLAESEIAGGKGGVPIMPLQCLGLESGA